MPFDFDAVTAPFRMQPGLRRLAADGARLTANDPGSAHLLAKLDVLRRDAGSALLAAPGWKLQSVLATLGAPGACEGDPALRVDGLESLVAPRLRWAVRHDRVEGDGPPAIGACLRSLEPGRRVAALASLAFAEDFAVVDGVTGCVPWLAVCLPSHWAPAQTLGLPLAAIHAPVADGTTLVAASQALVRLVTAGERWERFVWTLTPRAALDAHPARLAPAAWPVDAGAQTVAAAAFFRTEHQTFRPLAGDPGRALFSIAVEVVPLASVIDGTERARRLHDALASMSDAVLAYRGLDTARAPLLAWLAARAG